VALVVLLLFGRLRRLVDTGTTQDAGAAGGRS
jgi:hypothetical protein